MTFNNWVDKLEGKQFDPIPYPNGYIYYPRAYFAVAAQPQQAALFDAINRLPLEAQNLFNEDLHNLALKASALGRELLLVQKYDKIVVTIKNGKAVTGQITFNLRVGKWVKNPNETNALLAYLVQNRSKVND